MLVALLSFAWLFHGPMVGATAEPVGPAQASVKDGGSSVADLCRGSELCRQVVMQRTDGAVLLRVTFVHPQRYVDESDDYCDAREYW